MSNKETMLNIPFPRMTRNVSRGDHASGSVPPAEPTRPTSIRVTEEQVNTINRAASKLNMTFGEFVKWCGYYGAIEVEKELLRRSFSEAVDRPIVDTSGYK